MLSCDFACPQTYRPELNFDVQVFEYYSVVSAQDMVGTVKNIHVINAHVLCIFQASLEKN